MNKKLRNIEFKLDGEHYLKIKRTNPDKETYLVPGTVNLNKKEAKAIYAYLDKLFNNKDEKI
jgi:cytochrome c1